MFVSKCLQAFVVNFYAHVIVSSTSTVRFRSPIGEPYFIFGIGSACYDKPFNQSSSLNLKARYHDKAAQYFFQKQDLNHPVFKFWKKYDYQYVDVCSNHDNLTLTSINLLLDPKYTLMEDPSTKARRKITSWKGRSKILAVFFYLEQDLFQILSEMLTQTDVLIINIRDENVVPQNFYTIPGRVRIGFQLMDGILSHLFDAMQWKYVSLVLLQEEYGAGQIYFDRLRKLFQSFGICFNTEILPAPASNTDVDWSSANVTRRIQSNDDVNTVFLVGSAARQALFLGDFGASNKTWMLIENYELDRIPLDVGTVISIQDGLAGFRSYLKSLPMVKNYAVMFHTDTSYTQLKELESYDYLSKLYQELLSLDSMYSEAQATTNDLFFLKIKLRGHLTDQSQQILVDRKLVFRYYTYFFSNSELKKGMRPYMTNSSCPNVQCLPGREYLFMKLEGNSSQWNESFQWTCEPCEAGFYKDVYGNTSCQPCPILYVSNEKRDSCFDPYVLKVISIEQSFTLMAIGLTCFGLFSCFVVFAVFIKYRDTPVMKAANVNITLLHLVLVIVNFIVLLFAFYGESNDLKCFARLFSLTIFYTVILSVILLRSQKVLRAFGSRIKMTKSDIRKALLGEIFFVLVIVLINNLVLFIVVDIAPVQVLEILNESTLERTMHCNTSKHLNILSGFSIFLQCACFIQAFRGRRLPGAFKETMSIVYGSFISVLVFLIMYPIVVFQKDFLMKESVFWITITLNMNLLVMFSYYPRLYVALFQPRKNTVEYSRSVIMAKMKKESRNKVKTT